MALDREDKIMLAIICGLIGSIAFAGWLGVILQQ